MISMRMISIFVWSSPQVLVGRLPSGVVSMSRRKSSTSPLMFQQAMGQQSRQPYQHFLKNQKQAFKLKLKAKLLMLQGAPKKPVPCTSTTAKVFSVNILSPRPILPFVSYALGSKLTFATKFTSSSASFSSSSSLSKSSPSSSTPGSSSSSSNNNNNNNIPWPSKSSPQSTKLSVQSVKKDIVKIQPELIPTWKLWAFGLGFVIITVGGFVWLSYLDEKRWRNMKRQKKKVELPPFELVDQEGVVFTSANLLGHWSLIYFGFTRCPDICPDELEKLVKVIKTIRKHRRQDQIELVFITVDPERDDRKRLKKFLSQYDIKVIGLCGTRAQINQATKAYRVYTSVGPRDRFNDYIVDHTIISYLVDPEGYLAEYFGQTVPPEQIVDKAKRCMAIYQRLHERFLWWQI